MSFAERASEMGLTNQGGGCFYYGDRHGEVIYRELATKNGANMMDDTDVPYLALFTKEAGVNPELQWSYCGVLSDAYKFEGNEVINSAIRTAIESIGHPIFREETFVTPCRTQMHNVMIISHPSSHDLVGDIYPQITVTNSYNGTRAKGVAFGIHMNEGGINFGFKTKLSEMRQVHHEGHGTTMGTPIGGYVTAFTQDISELIETNFALTVSEADMLKTLDLVEKIGKRRRIEISEKLQQWTQDSNNPLNNWQLFLALTAYSTRESNLNAKRLLEDVAERVLIVPERMINTVQALRGAA